MKTWSCSTPFKPGNRCPGKCQALWRSLPGKGTDAAGGPPCCLGTLTAGLAHEIRNPLVAIKTFTQLLPERFDDNEFRNHFWMLPPVKLIVYPRWLPSSWILPGPPSLNGIKRTSPGSGKMTLLVDTESHKKNIRVLKALMSIFLPLPWTGSRLSRCCSTFYSMPLMPPPRTVALRWLRGRLPGTATSIMFRW